jgi:hypothetical protein
MGNLEELQKVDRLGGPLAVDLPLSDVQSSVNPPLRVRTALVAKLVVGLRYELATNPNFQFSLKQALGVFEGALEYLDQQGGGAGRDNGGDVVQYFIGRENFLLFQDPATLEVKRPAYLEDARAAFKRATELNPQYARAWSALGSVYFRSAQKIAPAERPVTGDIAQASSAYQSAISSAQAAQDKAAQTEAHLGLALNYRLQAETFLFKTPSDVALAEMALRQADDQVAVGEELMQPEQNRYRGFAAMARGLIAEEWAQIRLRAGDETAGRRFLQQAADAYGKCLAAGQTDPGDQFLRRQIIDVTCAQRKPIVAQRLENLQ